MVIAFIPVRGGSKSIPLKNIKELAGKPLVCWSIEELEQVDKVDKIVVSTDSDDIKKVVESKGYKKVEVVGRSEEVSSDTASTESVMLEYIQNSSLKDSDTFMLVQATSPLVHRSGYSYGLNMYETENVDSVLSGVIMDKFLWKYDPHSGSYVPTNYDYENRPRRQDMHIDYTYVENGAFYINSVGNIKRDKNRLSGKVGMTVLPKDTLFEIDEPFDWDIVEKLARWK